jgi:isochorismate hydrolase
MNEMVERVVRVIERNARRGRNGAYVTDIPKLAREVVKVMREPTAAMLAASWDRTVATTPEERMLCELGDAREAHVLKLRRRYRAMIDAALQEEKG